MEDMRLILGNAYEEIKKLPDKSVDLIITDPPYDIDTKYTSCMRNDIGKSYHSVIRELSADDLTSGIEFSILDDFLRVLKTVNIYIISIYGVIAGKSSPILISSWKSMVVIMIFWCGSKQTRFRLVAEII